MPPSPPHFPKHSISFRDFLREPDNPSLPRRGKGKKRNLSLSPTQPTQTNKKAAKSLPVIITEPINLNPSSMDTDLLEMDRDVDVGPLPSEAEAASLLEDSPPHPQGSPITDHEASPTVAIQSAIEAKINEELGLFGNAFIKPLLPLGTSDCGVIRSGNGSDTACAGAEKGNQGAAESTAVGPLAGPMHADSTLVKTKSSSGFAVGSQGAGAKVNRDPRIPNNRAAPVGDSGTRNTYADRTKTKIRPEELGTFILHVYTTHDRKNPLSLEDWKQVDEQLIHGLVNHPDLVHIVSSSYNAKHWFGYVACKDLESQDWVKRLVRGMKGNSVGYRAWSRDEKPFLPVCRLFLPSRFDSLDDETAFAQLCRYNPPLQSDSINLKGSEMVQGGRAIFLEMTPNVYQYIKDRDHRLCFLAAYVDCQPWTQSGPKRKVGLGQAIEGIRKLDSEPSQTLKTNTQMSADPGPVTAHPQNTTPMTEPNTNSPNPGSQTGEGKKRRKHRGGKNKKRGLPPTATQDSSNSTHKSNNNFHNTNSNNNVVINVTP